MEFGLRGLAILKSAKGEDVRLEAYDDATGKPVPKGGKAKGTLTIGYGHTGPDVTPGLTITMEQAEMLLRGDVKEAVAIVNRGIKRPMTQTQFDSFVLLAFNIGAGQFASSSARRLFNAGDPFAACGAMFMWRKDGGKDSLGLARRRVTEMSLFLEDGIAKGD